MSAAVAMASTHSSHPSHPSTVPASFSPEVPAQQQSFLAFDFGTQRTGVAAGNRLTRSAQAIKTVKAEGDARFAPIAALIKEWQPDALVVGVPRHPDGNPHEMTQRAQRFARQLAGRFNLPVHEVDERYSSVEAASQGAKDLDAESARIILEQFLRDIP
jgi:putative holliday junction resolvase